MFLSFLRIQSLTEYNLIYLCTTTCVHRLVVVKILQQTSFANAFEKMNMFFSPHPPNAFGRDYSSHFSHDIVKFSFGPDHMN